MTGCPAGSGISHQAQQRAFKLPIRFEFPIRGSFRVRYRKETMENVRDSAVKHGSYTEERFQELMDCFDDPSFHYVDVLWIGAWGRRPST